MKKVLFAIVSIMMIFALVFAGCAKNEETSDSVAPQALYEKAAVEAEMPADAGFGRDMDDEYMEEASEEYDGEGTNTMEDPEALSEKIIYNVHASLSVEDVEMAVKAVTDKVKALGGYISYSNTYTSGGYVYANVELRVPSQKLADMESYTETIGKVEERTMSTDNITESYYDIMARLDHSVAQEEQLLEILEKAETIEDILLVRAELDRVQERIESYRGRIRVWDSLVDYSTVTYNIRPIPTLDTEDDSPRLIKMDETWRAVKKGFNNSIIYVANFFSFLFRLLAVLFIPLVILGVIALVVIIIVKQAKKHKKNKQ